MRLICKCKAHLSGDPDNCTGGGRARTFCRNRVTKPWGSHPCGDTKQCDECKPKVDKIANQPHSN